MRILIVGADSNYAIERPYVKYLAAIAGVSSVDFFKAQNLFLDYYQKSVVNKILYRSGLSNILRQVNLKLKEVVVEKAPDVIWVFKGMEIFPETLEWIRNREIKIVNYNPDNPFVFSGRGSGNKNISKSIGLYHMHFTYDATVKKRIQDEFGITCSGLPFGFDLPHEVLEKSKQQQEVVKTCFLGSADQYRGKFINQLAKLGISVDVYGNGWNYFINNKNIKIHKAVYGDDFWYVLRKYRIQLNLMRPHNPNSHNMRTFEVPGVGGILLAPDTEDHQKLFTAEKEIFLYNGLNDCSEKINAILNLSSPASDEIRKAAATRSVLSGYSYRDRANYVVGEFRNLLNE